ncbi:MAG: hypothetical protein H6858_08465 [Rhodospirillales bacterium]|nr:hypothetical protein [Alphaproteobacteria bacterium]MCB1840851.1 hypothetical protein [Alphaproteobacteria bacterium]MCB9977614.1 hypothetical protein [Rhodospirillales bacterium]
MLTGLFGNEAAPLTAQGVGSRFSAAASTGGLDVGMDLTADAAYGKEM